MTIEYVTSPEAIGLQWLDPAQTEGKEHPFVFTDPKRLLAACEQDGLRGIISKHADSLYRSGRGDWIKVRCRASANHVPRP